MEDLFKRGELYYADLSPVVGSEQGGVRPVLVIQNDVGNKYSPTIIVAAITTEIKKTRQPTHVLIGSQFGLPQESMLMLEQLATIDKVMLQNFIGTADAEFMKQVDRALSVSVGVRPIRFSKRSRRTRKSHPTERPVVVNGS